MIHIISKLSVTLYHELYTLKISYSSSATRQLSSTGRMLAGSAVIKFICATSVSVLHKKPRAVKTTRKHNPHSVYRYI